MRMGQKQEAVGPPGLALSGFPSQILPFVTKWEGTVLQQCAPRFSQLQSRLATLPVTSQDSHKGRAWDVIVTSCTCASVVYLGTELLDHWKHLMTISETRTTVKRGLHFRR